MRAFEYFKPCDVKEACSLLYKYGAEAKALAGGTDLLIKIKRGFITPAVVVDLTGLEDLKYIRLDDGWIRIGALTLLREVATSVLLKERAGLLVTAAGLIGSRQIRNMATIGGNLCNAAPSADTAAPLLALEARVRIVGVEGAREVPLADFFLGPGQTCLAPGEILTEVAFPEPEPFTRSVYLKYTRREAMDIALVGVAAVLQFGEAEKVLQTARLALAAVAPTPIRVPSAEQVLSGLPLNHGAQEVSAAVKKAAVLAQESVRPITDVRASAEYRRYLVGVLVERAIRRLVG